MVNLRKAAVRLQKATSYDGTGSAGKKLRISPSNDQLTAKSNDLDFEDKTEQNGFFNTICFGDRRRKRRRLQYAGANRDVRNRNGGADVAYSRSGSLAFKQFTVSNQR